MTTKPSRRRNAHRVATVALALTVASSAACGGTSTATDTATQDETATDTTAQQSETAPDDTTAQDETAQDDTTAQDETAQDDNAADTAGATSPLPAVEVTNVLTGETESLDVIGATGKPTLVWFWAPH